MADKLTPQQQAAVENRGGKLLVSAAAGSGKTKVLVDRLLKYLTDPVDPANLDDFLIITYTKAAASELRGKIAAKLTERIAQEPENKHLQKQMQRLFLTKISTVHGFCGDILREYAYKLDIAPDFRVADENECREIRDTVAADLLERAYSAQEQSDDFLQFVDTQGVGRTDKLIPELIQKVYDSARCHLNPDGWLESCLAASDVEDMEDATQTIWGSYLAENFKEYLSCHIRVMQQCAWEAENSPGYEKVALNLRQTLEQLEELYSCSTWDEIIAKKDIDYGRLLSPKKAEDMLLIARIRAAREACKKGLDKKLKHFADDSLQVIEDLTQAAVATRGLVELVRQFDRDYHAAKRSRRVLDFGDLEHKTLDLLLGKKRSGPTVAAKEIGRRFREIMVDEYQDSNAVQDAIFSALTREKQNCFMVGDVKQSIYQFRLADPGIFLEKYHQYLPAEEAKPEEGRKVLLSHNFRSGAEVIEAVNAVFSACMSPKVGGLHYGEAEALREGVPHEKLPDPAVELYALEVDDETYLEESAFVADKIQDMLQKKTLVRKNGSMMPVEPEDIVILLRSPGSIGIHYQRALEARGIRCASGGGNDLLKTQEIATLRSLLQTVYNPRLDMPLISTLASPVFGFTADDLAAFRGKQKRGSVYDALLLDESPKCREFLENLQILRQEAKMNTLTQLLEKCFALTRMDSIFAAMPGGEAKTANLQMFYSMAADFEMGSQKDLGQFLEHLDALSEKGLIAAGSTGAGCVTIMSIHKSKGLEFPVVFLSGLSREFNRESLRAQILCDNDLGLGLVAVDRKHRLRYPTVAKRAISSKMAAESLSEEMRVLYVAMTRARDRLIMTYAVHNLEKDLKDIALRLDFDGGELLCCDVVCPGEWVLLAAMQRLEAGQLFALGGKPARTHISDYPWKIEVAQGKALESDDSIQTEMEVELPSGTEDAIRQGLSFRYGHTTATMAPSKQTATGRKGRFKDDEAAENTQSRQLFHSWRQPSFRDGKIRGTEYGSAIHSVLQYIRYESCASEEAVANEVDRLVCEGFLSPEQADMVNCRQIADFFASELGTKLRNGVSYIREFKFSILDDADRYGDGLAGEQVLLQGVVDCALLEEDGITVIDFKTDRVSEETLAEVAARYCPQVQTYGEALSRIYESPIKAQYLYFFQLNRFVEV